MVRITTNLGRNGPCPARSAGGIPLRRRPWHHRQGRESFDKKTSASAATSRSSTRTASQGSLTGQSWASYIRNGASSWWRRRHDRRWHGDLGVLSACLDTPCSGHPWARRCEGTLARTVHPTQPHMSKAHFGLDRPGVIGRRTWCSMPSANASPASSTTHLRQDRRLLSGRGAGPNIVGWPTPGRIRGVPWSAHAAFLDDDQGR